MRHKSFTDFLFLVLENEVYSRMLANYDELLELIPQKPPMVMVDTLLYSDAKKTVSQLQLEPSNLFCAQGYFCEAGIIENIAQTAALGSGYRARQLGDQPKTGFIGAIKRLKIFDLPADNSRLETEIILLHEMFNARVIRARVSVGEKTIAEGEMNIFLQNMP